MSFQMKYEITPKYLTKPSERRSGIFMPAVKFIVGHDTGNDGSSALGNIGYYENTRNVKPTASAHTFIDHTGIYECIPLTTGRPEKAWHVLYNKTVDNRLFGDDANDVAAGVELCYSYQRGSINNEEAYKRYVWYIAYLCYKFELDPHTKITGHFILDPGRKTDPQNALTKMGKNFDQLLKDVANEYHACLTQPVKAQTVKVESVQKPVKLVVPQWEKDIISHALKVGLVTMQHDPEEKVTKWFNLACLMNGMKIQYGGGTDWKSEIMKAAIANHLISDNGHKPDDLVPVWFCLQVLLNAIKVEVDYSKYSNWKDGVIAKSKEAGIITTDHDADSIVEKWFCLQVIMNALKL